MFRNAWYHGSLSNGSQTIYEDMKPKQGHLITPSPSGPQLIYPLLNTNLVGSLSSKAGLAAGTCLAKYGVDGVVTGSASEFGTVCAHESDPAPWFQVDMRSRYRVIAVGDEINLL